MSAARTAVVGDKVVLRASCTSATGAVGHRVALGVRGARGRAAVARAASAIVRLAGLKCHKLRRAARVGDLCGECAS